MKLIFGGAEQGKCQYAREHFGCVDDANILDKFHLFILELLEKDIDPVEYIKEHISGFRDKIIVCDDISCGIVPTDPLMRKWREATGRTLAVLADESDEVVRIFCGLGIRLK